MKFLRPYLLKLLKVTVKNEQSSREKRLIRQVEQMKIAAESREREYEEMLELAYKAVDELKQTIAGLNQTIESREKDIATLEHEADLLRYDVRGLTSINARLTKWVESIRIAEDQQLSGQELSKKLAEIEEATPWLVT